MTKQQLIDNATAKNFRIEFSKDKFGNEIIGINKNTNVWHWFEVYFSGNVFFHHSYSMNSGKVNKGIIHGIKILWTLEKN